MPEIIFLDELEKQFREVAERDVRVPAQPPRRRRRLALALACALAVSGAIALLAVNPFASGPSSLVAAAGAAAVPPSVVEHVVTLTEQIEDGRQVTVRDELWTASGDPLGSRVVIDNPAYGGRIERSDAQGVSSAFDASDGVIYERTLPANFINLDATRPSEDLGFVRRALAASNARDMGPTTLAGQPVERFDYGSRETTGQRCSYYATRGDYIPVAVDCVNLIGPALRAHISYEFLPRTDANDALLSLRAEHPGAAIDRAPITHCDQEPHYFGPGVAPDFAGDPRNAPCMSRGA
jgi:predicted RNA methylase